MSVISWLVSYHVLEIDSWHWGCSRTALYNWMAIQFIFIYIHVVDFFVPLLDFFFFFFDRNATFGFSFALFSWKEIVLFAKMFFQ